MEMRVPQTAGLRIGGIVMMNVLEGCPQEGP
jgi:hypothetical protein